LYEETGGKPVLLRWTAGQIGRGSCVTLADAIAYLRSCPEGNDPLEFIFGDLVEDFTEVETRVLCALTHFTLPAKVGHITEVAAFPEADVDRAVRRLINRSLVVPSEELITFVLVPLVADFLRKKRPEIVAHAGDRLEERAFALADENGTQYDRFPVLAAAWPTIVAALPRFVAGSNDRLQAVCNALNTFLNYTGRWDEQLALAQDAEKRAVTAEDLRMAGWRAYDAGWIHYSRGQSTEVLDCADRAERYWDKSKAGARERAGGITLRGHGHSLARNYAAAIAAHRQAVELNATVDQEGVGVAVCLNHLAVAEKAAGDSDAAERDYREALRIAKVTQYDEGISIYTGNLANLFLVRRDWASAESLSREALVVAEKTQHEQSIAMNSCRLARALARQGKKAEALPYARRAVDILGRLRSRHLAWAEEILTECES
jgi:tetratricopeptide (TPR) repeat protein